jgi:hypothetical protein
MRLNHVFALVLAVFAVSAQGGTPEWGTSAYCRHAVIKEAGPSVITLYNAIVFAGEPTAVMAGSLASWSQLDSGITTPGKMVRAEGVKVASWSAMDMSVEASYVYATATQRWEKPTGVDLSQVASIEMFSSEQSKPTFSIGVFYDVDGQMIASGGSIGTQHFSCDN